MAQGMQVRVKNGSSSAIIQGKVVYITGFDDVDDFVPIVGIASYDDPTTLPALGIVREEILSGSVGNVKVNGVALVADTSRTIPGQDVYVGLAGSVVFVDPLSGGSGLKSQLLGKVLTVEENGQVFLFPIELNKSVRHPELEDILPDDHHDEDHAGRHSVGAADPINHGNVAGLTDADHHPQYINVDASRGFSAAWDAGQDITVKKLTAETSVEFQDATAQTTAAHGLFVVSGAGHSQNNSLTRYAPLGGDLVNGATSTAESDSQIKMSGSGVVNKIRCVVRSNSVNGTTIITLRKNGSNTTLDIGISSSSTGEFENAVNSVSYVDEDKLSYSIRTTGTGGSINVSLIQLNNQVS